MQLKTEGTSLIIGQAHFIKTVEDLYEALITTAPQAAFGIAFNEASGERLIRHEGNSKPHRQTAVHNARELAAGHVFVIALGNAFPIQVLPRIRECQEVMRIFCATANPLEVVVAETAQGRGVLGVIDGEPPLGTEARPMSPSARIFCGGFGTKNEWGAPSLSGVVTFGLTRAAPDSILFADLSDREEKSGCAGLPV